MIAVIAAPTHKLLELTDKARDYLEEQDVTVERRGRGGIVHRFWQHRIKELFEAAGWSAKVELFDADVYVNIGDAERVVEVAIGNNKCEVEHVKQHLDTGYDSIWIVCRNEDGKDGLRERLAESDLLEGRVTFRLFRDISDAELVSIG